MFSPITSLLRNGRAALLLVAVACLTPDRASAGCGNHTPIFSPALIASPDSPSAAVDAPTPAPPCHGPNCSGAPEPVLPPVAVAPPAPAAEAVLPTQPVLSGAARGSFARGPAQFAPIRRPLPVFHPPRHV